MIYPKEYRNLLISQSLIFFCFLIKALGIIPIPQGMILAVAMIAPFFLNEFEVAAYIVGFSMMGTGIQTAYIAVACFASILIKKRGKIPFVIVAGIIIFACAEMMHMFGAQEDTLVEYARYICVYIALFYFLASHEKPEDKRVIVDSYIYGAVFSVIHIFIEMYIFFGGDFTKFVSGQVRFGYASQLGTNLTFAADPNLVGQSCAITIALGLSLILLGYFSWKYIITTGICLFAGLMTISKTFFVAIGLIAVCIILFSGDYTNKKMIGRRLGLIVCGCIMVYILSQVYPQYFENLLSRVDTNDITTGRTGNAMRYLEYLSNNTVQLFFGVGMQNVGAKIGYSGSPHNTLIEMLVCWGILGTFAMIVFLIYSIRLHRSRSSRFLNYIPLLVLTFMAQSTQFFRLRDRIFSLIVVICFTGIESKLSIDQHTDLVE